ncbi:MAG: porin family protein [Bacteroidota bacterium]
MKKIIIIPFLALCTFVQAQGEIRVGIIGSLNNTYLLNGNVSNRNYKLDYENTFGGSFGFSFNYQLTKSFSIDANALISKHKQNYKLNFVTEAKPDVAELKNKLRYFDFPVLFKLKSKLGIYFEVGPQFSVLFSDKETFDYPGSFLSYEDQHFKRDFRGFGLCGVIGSGVDIHLNEKIDLTTGIRMGYMFTDATCEFKDPNEKYPLDIKFTPVYGYDGSHSVNSAINYYANNYVDYKRTNRVWAGINVGLTYKIEKKE